MASMRDVEIFKRFLSNNIPGRLATEFRKSVADSGKNLDAFYRCAHKRTFVNGAFSWAKTESGFEAWGEVDYLWKKHIENYPHDTPIFYKKEQCKSIW